MRASACPVSSPIGPPPRISSRSGTRSTPVASRFVHTPSSSRNPGTGGITGSEPVAITISRAVYTASPTATRPGPSSRPAPRSTSMPAPAAQSA
jgi:hypothetical protein